MKREPLPNDSIRKSGQESLNRIVVKMSQPPLGLQRQYPVAPFKTDKAACRDRLWSTGKLYPTLQRIFWPRTRDKRIKRVDVQAMRKQSQRSAPTSRGLPPSEHTMRFAILALKTGKRFLGTSRGRSSAMPGSTHFATACRLWFRVHIPTGGCMQCRDATAKVSDRNAPRGAKTSEPRGS